MWSEFNLIDAEDEIINSRFSVKSVFKVSNNEPSFDEPGVIATYHNGKIAIAIDRSAYFIENESDVGQVQYLSFESSIDCLDVSKDGRLVICGLRDGNIYGIYLNGVVLFHVTIDKNDLSATGKTFIGIEHFEEAYYLMCSNGQLYKVSNIEYTELSESLPANETLCHGVALAKEAAVTVNGPITCFTLSEIDDQFTVIVGGLNMVKFSRANHSHIVDLPEECQGVKKIYDTEHFIMVLTNSGLLVEVCPFTHFYKQIKLPADKVPRLGEDLSAWSAGLESNVCVKDVIVLQITEETIELQLLVKPKDIDTHFIKIVDYSSWDCRSEVPVPQNTWMLNQPMTQNMNMYYLSGMDSSPNAPTKDITMRIISENEPENRLMMLIHRGLLDDAEKFAVEFSLSHQPIYEAKAENIMNKIRSVPQENKELLEQHFQELLEVANLITNTEFLLKLQNVEINNRRVLAKILNFLLKHINVENNRKVENEIKEKLLRLETLSLIDRAECDYSWRKFVDHSDIGVYCFKYMKTDISKVCIILNQHASSILPQFNEERIRNILNSVPEDIVPFDIIQLLRHLMPMVSSHYPKSLPILTDWAIHRITSLQNSANWPEIGLEFGQNVLEVLTNIKITFKCPDHRFVSNFNNLKNIIDSLEELTALKLKFNLILSFDDYLNSSMEESALEILRRIPINNINDLVNNYLQKIYNKKGVCLVPTLVKHIDFLIGQRDRINSWQQRAVNCTLLIREQRAKFKCALQIIKAAPNWSNELGPLLQLASSNYSLGTDIRTEHQRHQLKDLKIKYGWTQNAIEQVTNNLKFVYRMVHVGGDDLFEDFKLLLQLDNSIKFMAHYYYVHENARLCRLDKSIEFLKTLEGADLIKCRTNLYKTVPNSIELPRNVGPPAENMKELLQYVAAMDPDQEKALQHKHENTLRKIFKISDASLSEGNKEEYLKQGIDFIINDLRQTHERIVCNTWVKVKLLTRALDVSIPGVVLKICQQVDNVHFTCALSMFMLEHCELGYTLRNAYIDLAVLLLFQEIKLMAQNRCDNIGVSMSYPMAYKILQKVYQEIGVVVHEEISRLIEWTMIGYDAFDSEVVTKYLAGDGELDERVVQMIVNSITKEDTSNNEASRRDSLSVFQQVSESHHQLISDSSRKPDPVIKSLCLGLLNILTYPELTLSFTDRFKYPLPELSNIRGQLFTSLDRLVKIKDYPSVFSIAVFIRQRQKNTDKKIISNDYYSTIIRSILKSALQQKDPEINFLMNYLVGDPSPREALEYLEKELKSGLSKLNYLHLAEKYAAKNEGFEVDRTIRFKYQYYMDFCQMDPNLKGKLNITTYDELFKTLNNKIVDVTLLENMSRDFGWNLDKVLVAQIITILSIQELEFDIKSDILGAEQISVKMDPTKLVVTCQPYISNITDVELLINALNTFTQTINSYFYELYLVVMDILQQVSELSEDMEKRRNILLFLKHKMVTERSNRVSSIESDWWMNSHTDTAVLPRIAKYRFPFLLIIQEPLDKILDNEVNIENCGQWCPLIKLHMNLMNIVDIEEIRSEQDKFCMTALKNSISEYKLINNTVPDQTWNLQPVNNAFLQSVLRLIEYIHSVYRIILVLYYVTENAPDGADKVEAAYECYKFSIEHETELQKEARSAQTVQKIRRKYPMYKTLHLLHLFGLNDDKLFKLVETPRELIKALYNHDLVVKSENNIDINQVAQEIAALHDLDCRVLQISLLKKWLSSSDEASDDLDQTLCDDMNTTVVNNTETEELCTETVARASYILKSWDSKTAIDFLLALIYSTDDEANSGHKLNIYECFMRLKNETTSDAELLIEQQIMDKFKPLTCIHHLKQFGYNFTAAKFVAYDKMTILKNLWRTHATKPKALEAMHVICIAYDINESIIWGALLKQMVQLRMEKEITIVYGEIVTKPELNSLDEFVAAVEFLLRCRFKNISQRRTLEQDEQMSKALFLLQSCPIKNKINLVELAETCVRQSQVHIAGILLAFADGEQKAAILKLLEPLKKETLKQAMIDMAEFGIYKFVVNKAIVELF